MLVHPINPAEASASQRPSPKGAAAEDAACNILQTLIILALTRIIARLEDLFQLWKAGLLPTAPAAKQESIQRQGAETREGRQDSRAPSRPCLPFFAPFALNPPLVPLRAPPGMEESQKYASVLSNKHAHFIAISKQLSESLARRKTGKAPLTPSQSAIAGPAPIPPSTRRRA